MRFIARKKTNHEDIVAASLSEVVLFFLFFCLILLGSVFEADGFKNGNDPVSDMDLQDAKQSVVAMKAQIEGLKQSIAELERQISDQRVQIGNLKASMTGGEIEMSTLRIANRRLKRDNALLAEENRTLGKQVTNLRETLAKAKKKNGDLETKVAVLEGKLAQQDQRIGALGRQIEGLKKQLDEQGDDQQTATGKLAEAERQNKRLAAEKAKLVVENKVLQARVKTLENEASKRTDLPVAVSLDESDGYTFAFSSSVVSDDFEDAFMSGSAEEVAGVKQVIDLFDDATANIEAIEVIGHTDEVGFDYKKRKASNLDDTLVKLMNSQETREPVPSDNVGLGMTRAVAAALYLKTVLETHEEIPEKYRGLPIIPLSAGQLQRANGALSSGSRYDKGQPDKRRRIEIRLRSNTRRLQ